MHEVAIALQQIAEVLRQILKEIKDQKKRSEKVNEC